MDDQDLLAGNYQLRRDPVLSQNVFEKPIPIIDMGNIDGNFLGKVHPCKFTRTFQVSKNIVKTVRKCPRSMVDAPDPSRKLTYHQIELFNSERRLQATRIKMEKAQNIINHRWMDLEEKELQLRENFCIFHKFITENADKSERASKLIEHNKANIQERQEVIRKLKFEIEEMREIQDKMERYIQKHIFYKEFLEEVCNITPSFKYVNEIILRFQELVEKKQDLIKRQKISMDGLEKAKTCIMKLIEEKNFVIMGLNNQIANLQARYENANIKALESEELVTQIKNNAVKQMGEIDTVKNSIWNVYVHMATSKKHPIKIKKDNVEEQMMYINRTLTELSKVNKLIKKRASRAATKMSS